MGGLVGGVAYRAELRRVCGYWQLAPGWGNDSFPSNVGSGGRATPRRLALIRSRNRMRVGQVGDSSRQGGERTDRYLQGKEKRPLTGKELTGKLRLLWVVVIMSGMVLVDDTFPLILN